MRNLFLSTFTNKVDSKGRVSVPSPFRSMLVDQGFAGVIAYSSLIHNCLECCSIRRMESLYETISKLDPFSPQRDALETYILGGSLQLAFDSEGRILLSDDLRNAFGIADKASFIGKGSVFEVWSPLALQKHMLDARRAAVESKFFLGRTPAYGREDETEADGNNPTHCGHKAAHGRLQHQSSQRRAYCCCDASKSQLSSCGRVDEGDARGQSYQIDNTDAVMSRAAGYSQHANNLTHVCAETQNSRFIFSGNMVVHGNKYSLPWNNVAKVDSVSFCLRGIDE